MDKFLMLFNLIMAAVNTYVGNYRIAVVCFGVFLIILKWSGVMNNYAYLTFIWFIAALLAAVQLL